MNLKKLFFDKLTPRNTIKLFLCEKVGNSEKSSEALKIQNGQFEKREEFGIRSALRQGQPNS
jgi:hypothetical protein